MSWSTNTKDATLGKQGGGGTPLPVGKFNYVIAGVAEVPDKKDATGKQKQVVFDFTRNGTTHKVWFSPESDSEVVAKIAGEQIGAIGLASGFKGVLKPQTLKSLVNKSVSLDCYLNKKGYVTIGGIDVADDNEDETEPEEESSEEEEAEETEAEEEEEKPKDKTRKNPWDK